MKQNVKLNRSKPTIRLVSGNHKGLLMFIFFTVCFVYIVYPGYNKTNEIQGKVKS